MGKLMQLAAKRAAKKAKKRATKRTPRKTALTDAELAADLRSAGEAFNTALRSLKAAEALLDNAVGAVQASGLSVVQSGIRYSAAGADEIRFPEISRPL